MLGRLVLAACGVLLVGCGEPPPSDALALEHCVKLNIEPLPQTPEDPHVGTKDVFGCGVPKEALRPPYPDGTLIVKLATRQGQGFPWLLATARKVGGQWAWAEYTRNFAEEEYAKLPVREAVCTDCHAKVAAIDYIYTRYTER